MLGRVEYGNIISLTLSDGKHEQSSSGMGMIDLVALVESKTAAHPPPLIAQAFPASIDCQHSLNQTGSLKIASWPWMVMPTAFSPIHHLCDSEYSLFLFHKFEASHASAGSSLACPTIAFYSPSPHRPTYKLANLRLQPRVIDHFRPKLCIF